MHFEHSCYNYGMFFSILCFCMLISFPFAMSLFMISILMTIRDYSVIQACILVDLQLASGSGGMSTQQLQRMEANRRRAQAKLTAKRVAPPHTGVQGLPHAKRHAYTTSAATTSKMASTFLSSSSYDNVRSHPNSAEASSSSSAGNQV